MENKSGVGKATHIAGGGHIAFVSPMKTAGRQGFEKGSVKCFQRVPQAFGLYCSYHTSQASKGNIQKQNIF